MTFLERYEHEKRWQQKVLIIEMYHLAQKMKNLEWGFRDTAKYFDLSVGGVSEAMKIARAMRSNPKVLQARNKTTALEIVKGMEKGTFYDAY